jgi:hypothetical protein
MKILKYCTEYCQYEKLAHYAEISHYFLEEEAYNASPYFFHIIQGITLEQAYYQLLDIYLRY